MEYTYIVGAAVLIVGWGMLSYNGLIRLRNMTTQAWAGIDVQLKRRSDLIPNITKIVSGYAKHEKELFLTIAKLRTQLLTQQNTASTASATLFKVDTQLSQSVKQLLAVAESYPQLKANENYLQLQRELSNTENQIAASRRIYNENVTLYNTAIQSFPKNILACSFRFTTLKVYSLDVAATPTQ